MCHKNAVKLKRGRPNNRRPGNSEKTLVVYLGAPEYAALKEKAAAMHTSTVELAGTLLQAIVGSDLYEAVLDLGPGE